ncbi:phosphoglycerate mutase-like protein [Punctularia strigosozonata HHB-11173 SS5]|uniref:Phosphoglycerate mutase-like protein n=1 Tax=Punctularia strigosozonata (strain HHB-11173) TaxID=741275 RepID=R7S103_PUNST|nr:phosphoglycerate mutase-like protein [Punctularia strigosozonata HHB-11173 SS5]EIN04060.1 phosphoglycerate mutase-like protein [Punctularia strigosozonata HHB-11173 SS5]
MLVLQAVLALVPLVLSSGLVAAAPSKRHGSSSSSETTSVYDRLGNLAPYHQAPVPSGVHEDLPSDCTVDQVMLMGRHGDRYPLGSELVYIQGLAYKIGNATAAIKKAKLPSDLAFLKDGYTTKLGTNDLTAPGRQTLFDHGVAFRLKYPQFNATAILAGAQDRVIESAQWFAQGYYGRIWPNISSTVFSTIPEDDVTISWITPMDTCADWDYNYGNNATITWGNVYLPPIAKRLNKAIPGVNLTTDDVHGALYACAYDLAAWGTSPWCGAFTESEIADFEYELDVLMDGAFGYNLPGKMGPTLGALYVDKLIERFSNKTGDAEPIYLEFGHDTTIDMILTALGLAKDTPRLSASGPVPAHRKWRTSEQVPFGAQMIWEKFSCTSSFEGPQIRLVLNDAPMPLTFCETHATKEYGTCAFSDFVKANAFSTSITWGDAAWNATCGASDF